MIQISETKRLTHLYSRAGFGITYKELAAVRGKSTYEAVEILFSDSEKYSFLNVIEEKDIPKKKDFKNLSETEKKKLRLLAKDYMRDLNIAWIKKMQETTGSLREKMTFFWHGHFACRAENPIMAQELNNIHRKYALGNFRELLLAVSKSAAMLTFLNNQQNRKSHPNENFARELMELFTIGRGNYTEQDIKESARAFTGWSFDRNTYEFEMNKRQHDFGEKIFLGNRGNFDGTDIIDIILEKKETAVFLCRKIYRFFVNDVIDEHRVEELANIFYDSKYDIGFLMKKIFMSDWFYELDNIGAKIKSPVEFIVNLNKTFPVKYEDEEKIIYLQHVLGQILFFPPNVAGWSGGRNWIDSSTLMLRLKLPSVILNSGVIEFEPKEEYSEEYYSMMQKQMDAVKKKINKKIKTITDWKKYTEQFSPDITQDEFINSILSVNLSDKKQELISSFQKENFKAIALQLTSFPEYQMC